MNDMTTYIDFDGVILNSEERMLERKAAVGLYNHKDENEFNFYFNYTNDHPEEWDYIIRGAKSINDSVEIIRELEFLKKKIAILTKVHTLQEMKVKVDDLRNNRKIDSPIYFVPPGIKKHQIIIPNNQLLIDDYYKNVLNWIKAGGQGYVFDKSINQNTSMNVKSLEFLLRRGLNEQKNLWKL